MLRFVPDHLKSKIMCKNALKKLQFVMRFVPHRYNTQEICDKFILEISILMKMILIFLCQAWCNRYYQRKSCKIDIIKKLKLGVKGNY